MTINQKIEWAAARHLSRLHVTGGRGRTGGEMKKMDGGPAFPLEKARAADGSDYYPAEHVGMTLRDYYAAKAMQAELGVGLVDAQALALRAYAFADAMIAERAKS